MYRRPAHPRARSAALVASLAALLAAVTALLTLALVALTATPSHATEKRYPYTVTATWLLPPSWDYAVTPPGNVPGIWPQDRHDGPAPSCRWLQVDTYRIDDARDRAILDGLGDVLVNGEDSRIYQSHVFVPGPPCATPEPTPTPTPEPTWTPDPTPSPTPHTPSPTVTPEQPAVPSATPTPTVTPETTALPAPSTSTSSTPPSPGSSGGPSSPQPAVGQPPAGPATSTTPTELATTGASGAGWALAGMLVLLGSGLVAARRRARSWR